MKIDPTQPAFPMPQEDGRDCAYFQENGWGGLTVRAYFAAKAMQGLCLTASPRYETGHCNAFIAERAVLLADALIAELNRKTPND